ncbi:MAG: hypothetical protein ABSG84_08750 [Acidobacteriaceae bacterium]
MGRIVNRIAAISGTARACAFSIAIAGCLAGAQASAQATGSEPAAAKPPAPATYSGCVQKAPNSTTDLVISTPAACARLTGNVSADTLAGHQVELTGILTPRTPSAAASIQVGSVSSVGKACTDVCSLHPPGTRGLQRPSNGAVPGSEGGTPGLTTTPQP